MSKQKPLHWVGPETNRKIWRRDTSILCEKIKSKIPNFDAEEFISALMWAKDRFQKPSFMTVNDLFSDPLIIAERLADTKGKIDRETILAAALYPAVRAIGKHPVDPHGLDEITKRFGARTCRIVKGTLRLRALDIDPLKVGASQPLQEFWRNAALMSMWVADVAPAILIRCVQRELYISEVGPTLPLNDQSALLTMTRKVPMWLAAVVGYPDVASNLGDACFRLEAPDEYKRLQCLNSAPRGWQNEAKRQILDALAGVRDVTEDRIEIGVRRKTPDSIREKQERKNKSLGEVGDFLGIRVVLLPEQWGMEAHGVGDLDDPVAQKQLEGTLGALSREIRKKYGKGSHNPEVQALLVGRKEKNYYTKPQEDGRPYKAIHVPIALSIDGKWVEFELQMVTLASYLSNECNPELDHAIAYKGPLAPKSYEDQSQRLADLESVKAFRLGSVSTDQKGEGDPRDHVYVTGPNNQIHRVSSNDGALPTINDAARVMVPDAAHAVSAAYIETSDPIAPLPRGALYSPLQPIKDGQRIKFIIG